MNAKPLDVAPYLDAIKDRSLEDRGIAKMAQNLIASEILAIAGEIRALVKSGADVINLTVGDFVATEFPIPARLGAAMTKAVADGHTNYPPSSGIPELREAIRTFYAERLGLRYPIDSILVAGGARPMIAGTFLSLIDPGDVVVYGVPSWNNNHYSTLTSARPIEIQAGPGSNFFPRAADLAPHLERARLLCLCTPQNPTGTVMGPSEVEAIARLVLEENQRRLRARERPLYLMFDQVYWMLTFHGRAHTHPLTSTPELAPYTIFVDAISKSFAATGLRVGWAVGPQDLMTRMGAILTHIGAWAPRPAQVATAELLGDTAAVDAYQGEITRRASERLDLLATGVARLRAEGHDVEAVTPEGAIYLSMRFGLAKKRTPTGAVLETDEDVRRYLLTEAGVALVPFNAFGVKGNTGWFRASVGAISTADAARVGERLSVALGRLR